MKPISSALRFWESRRLLYNLWLALLTLIAWGPDILAEDKQDWLGAFVVIGFFAFIANAFYCAAYVAEALLHFAPTETVHSNGRSIVLLTGTTIATALALWILLGQGMA